jgi:hypothetical protein
MSDLAAGGASRYLLFAGSHRTDGGLQDLVGVFDAEPEARATFRGLRLGTDVRADWAELAAVDANGRVRVLCWFGRSRPAPLSRPRPRPAPAEVPARRRMWLTGARSPVVAAASTGVAPAASGR